MTQDQVHGQVLNAGAWVNISTQLPGDVLLLLCGTLEEPGLWGDPSHWVEGAHCEWRSFTACVWFHSPGFTLLLHSRVVASHLARVFTGWVCDPLCEMC